MGSNSSIEWTDATWNPLVGCEKVSPGCAHCYAETMAKRLRAMALADIDAGKDPGRKRHYIDAVDEHGRWTGKLIPVPEALADPLHWRRPRRVFVNSMSDLFHESVPDAFITAVFGVMAAAPLHTFQVLTKRPERMAAWCEKMTAAGGVGKFIRSDAGRNSLRGQFIAVEKNEVVNGERVRCLDDPWMQVMNGAAFNMGAAPLSNVWLGCSVEDQKRADERIPHLLRCSAAVRFVSAEPLLGPIDLTYVKCPEATDGYLTPIAPMTAIDCLNGATFAALGGGEVEYKAPKARLDWVIVGGESGAGARACEVAWVESIRDQCRTAGVACFVKQLGAVAILRDNETGGAAVTANLRDKKGGDWDEWPEDLRVREFPQAKGTE